MHYPNLLLMTLDQFARWLDEHPRRIHGNHQRILCDILRLCSVERLAALKARVKEQNTLILSPDAFDRIKDYPEAVAFYLTHVPSAINSVAVKTFQARELLKRRWIALMEKLETSPELFSD